MKVQERRVMDLRSQDLAVSDLELFKQQIVGTCGGETPEELIMFSSASRPYQFTSISEFEESVGSIPDDASYFYYTLSFKGGRRSSLYLDPDRPGKTVIEGPVEWVDEVEQAVSGTFPRGGERYRVHQRFGILFIWGIVVTVAMAILVASYLLYGLDPYVISVVIFTSSMLGIYLSVVKSKELQPANTISFVKRRRFVMESLLHLITVALGIVSAVLAAVIVRGLL